MMKKLFALTLCLALINISKALPDSDLPIADLLENISMAHESEDLIEVEKLEISPEKKGTGYERFEGEYQRQRVFIKKRLKDRRKIDQLYNEAKWLVALDMLGVSVPKFFGFTLVDGQKSIVMSYLPGHHLGLRDIRAGVEPEIASQVLDIIIRLDELGVRFAHDIQFRLTPHNKVFLIDTEFFSVNPPEDLSPTSYYELVEQVACPLILTGSELEEIRDPMLHEF